MHFLTRVGVSKNDGNAHYCLDLESDINVLRKLDDAALAERMTQEPRPIRRLKINSSPLLYPLWDIDAERFVSFSENELNQRASSVRSDPEFMNSLTRAAASVEPIYARSDHIELQIYGGNFFSDSDLQLCQRFHAVAWEDRIELASRFSDQRLRRLARRLIFFERPKLMEDHQCRAIAEDIFARRHGLGIYNAPPWTTIASALSEIETMGETISGEYKLAYQKLA